MSASLMKSWLPHAGTVLQYKDNFQLVKRNGVRMVLLLEISTPCKVQAEWPRMDVIVLTLVLRLIRILYLGWVKFHSFSSSLLNRASRNAYFIHKTILVCDMINMIAQIHTNTQRKVSVTSCALLRMVQNCTTVQWYDLLYVQFH